jgi:L-threonylcarbamoyladenylate synthase
LTVASSQNIRYACRVLDRGGVIAYPTEGVYGLGCLADDFAAVSRILEIKQRDPAMGLVLIISHPDQLDGWVDVAGDDLSLPSSDDKPVTWIVPATEQAPQWIRGKHTGLAVRQTTHPVANALCRQADAALVSTSANISGHPPARTLHVLRRQFGALVDYIVPGACGPAAGASEIRDLATGKVLRTA